MRIGFLYYNCLGFGLASDYTDVVLNTVLDIVAEGFDITWPLCSSCTGEKC